MMRTAKYWIKLLGLRPHPEGGYYRETYRSIEKIRKLRLPGRYGGDRAFSTAIYYLLAGNQRSCFHRLKSDETWHFYDGSSAWIYAIEDDDRLLKKRLGLDAHNGARPQIVMQAGTWFAARPVNPRSYVLVGCTVAPGFDFADFEIGARQGLISRFPRHTRIIERMTPPADCAEDQRCRNKR